MSLAEFEDYMRVTGEPHPLFAADKAKMDAFYARRQAEKRSIYEQHLALLKPRRDAALARRTGISEALRGTPGTIEPEGPDTLHGIPIQATENTPGRLAFLAPIKGLFRRPVDERKAMRKRLSKP